MIHVKRALQAFSYKTEQRKYDHNHICCFYHHILDIVGVISHMGGPGEGSQETLFSIFSFQLKGIKQHTVFVIHTELS